MRPLFYRVLESPPEPRAGIADGIIHDFAYVAEYVRLAARDPSAGLPMPTTD